MASQSIEKNDIDLEQGAPMNRQITYSLTAEQFEKLYLQPGGIQAKGDLSKRFGNPTLLGLISFLVCVSTNSVQSMGWDGVSAASSVTLTGGAYFVGGLGLFTAGLLEWVLGNTLPFTIFCSFGSFWFAFGYLIQPTQMIAMTLGAGSVDYNGGVALYLTCYAFLGLLFMIAALRTNVVFVMVFLFLQLSFWPLIVANIHIGKGQLGDVATLLKVSGSFGFLTSVCGWYLLIVTLFSVAELPISLPVGDLSGFLAPRSAPKQA